MTGGFRPMKRNISHSAVSMTAVVLGLLLGAAGAFAEPLIQEFTNLIDARQSADWTNLAGREIELEGLDGEQDVVNMKMVEDLAAKDLYGEDKQRPVLYMESRPVSGQSEFGMEGCFTLTLPAKRFYQFQGSVEALEGRNEGMELSVVVKCPTTVDGETVWAADRIFSGKRLGVNEYGQDITFFALDLSDWAGREIQVCLSMKVNADFSKIGDRESWSPNLISAQWSMARIVGSAFRVILGEPEKVSSLTIRGKTYRDAASKVYVQSVTGYPTSAEELILNGTSVGSGGDWHLTNPAESGVNTTYIPADGDTPGRFVAYITSRLYPTDISSATHPYPRLIDFRNQTTKNMGNATANEIYNAGYIDPNNDAAKMVIWPDEGFSDEWPDKYGHVAFSSVISSNYTSLGGGTVNVLHAYAHVEDSDQNDDGIKNASGTYEHIGYARSRAGIEDFGREFQKTDHTSGNTIIRHVSAEEDIDMKDISYGCGGASVFGTTDYYYMIYHARPIIKKVNGLDIVGAAGIAIARATKSAIDSWAYPYAGNPWVKYKQIVSATTSSLNWGQPGIGGLESILWNAKIENGLRSSYTDVVYKWRAYAKVSYNTYLDQYYDHQMLLICKAGIAAEGVTGVVIHTSDNLLEWSDYIVVNMDEPKSESYFYTYEYPT